jgi:hypothetical protein
MSVAPAWATKSMPQAVARNRSIRVSSLIPAHENVADIENDDQDECPSGGEGWERSRPFRDASGSLLHHKPILSLAVLFWPRATIRSASSGHGAL